MKKIVLLSLSCCISLCTYSQTTPSNWQKKESLSFVENKGQIRDQYGNSRPDIDFRLQGPDVNIFIGDAALHYQWQQSEIKSVKDLKSLSKQNSNSYRMDVTLLGADKNAVVVKEQKQNYYEQYHQVHLGLSSTIAHAYSKITYQNVYPGIDWVLYLDNNSLGKQSIKYDFVVKPGANVANIKLKYDGATNLQLRENGSLLATTPMGTITEDAPYSYEVVNGSTTQRTKVSSQYIVKDNILSFATADYKGTLVIDPAIEWATYYGGAGFDLGTVLACDNVGNVYLTGASWMGMNIATTGSHQVANAGDFDAFLAKFDTDGNRLWATYYGGASVDYGFGLVCDVNNRVYISGSTQSPAGIATTGSHQATKGTGTDNFLARFSSTGSLIWATYYGGNAEEYNGICATDNMGHIYLAGNTSSTNNIADNGHQSTFGGGIDDAFLAKFDTSGVRIWGTYYGGSTYDDGNGVACDLLGNVFLGGTTNSTNAISTTGSHQPALGGAYDNYLVKFNSAGVRQWATYYGGTVHDNSGVLRCVATDKQNSVYLTGHTQSTNNIATIGSHQDTLGGGVDAFLVKFNAAGTRVWGTYFGGVQNENGGAIACDLSDKIFWCGMTVSTSGIATSDAHQTTFGGGTENDAYLARFSTNGVQEYGTYYGGSSLDEGYAIAFDNVGNAYLSGGTTSAANIATPGSFSDTYGGGIAVFLAKFCTSVTAPLIDGPDTACANAAIQYTASTLPGATGYIWTLPSGWVGTSNTSTIDVVTNGTGGVVSVQIIRCDTSSAQTLNVYVRPEVPAIITANNLVLSTTNTHSTYQWMLNNNAIAGATNATHTATEIGNYTVAVTNNPGGCKDTSELYTVTSLVSVKDANANIENIKVYPNPANDVLFINATQEITVAICSVEGKVVLQQKNAKSIDISKLTPGLYLMKIKDKNGIDIGTKKFTKITNR